MTNTIDHLASKIQHLCFVIEYFTLDAKDGKLDNIELLSARVDNAMEAIQELRGLVGGLEQELMAIIDHARALNSSFHGNEHQL